jgi:hypothetical protein
MLVWQWQNVQPFWISLRRGKVIVVGIFVTFATSYLLLVLVCFPISGSSVRHRCQKILYSLLTGKQTGKPLSWNEEDVCVDNKKEVSNCSPELLFNFFIMWLAGFWIRASCLLWVLELVIDLIEVCKCLLSWLICLNSRRLYLIGLILYLNLIL